MAKTFIFRGFGGSWHICSIYIYNYIYINCEKVFKEFPEGLEFNPSAKKYHSVVPLGIEGFM